MVNEFEQSLFARTADFSKGVVYRTTGRGTTLTTRADGKTIHLPRRRSGVNLVNRYAM